MLSAGAVERVTVKSLMSVVWLLEKEHMNVQTMSNRVNFFIRVMF